MKQDLIIGTDLPDHNLTCVYLVFLIYVTLFIPISKRDLIKFIQGLFKAPQGWSCYLIY